MKDSETELPREFNARPGIGPGGLVAMGVLSLALGAFALAFPLWASLGVELIAGAALLVAGVTEVVRAVSLRGVGRTAWNLVFGLLAAAVGLLMLFFPLQGLLTLTLVLSVFFLAGGAFKTLAALQWRPAPGWGWLLASGLLSLALGVIVLAGWPGSALWLLGVLLGIDLVFLGAAQIAFGLGARDA